jgi:uncharacterized lipoprotein
MKKSSLLVTLPALALVGLLLSGCGMFRTTKAWETAKQESPLEIPPGMDTPPANDALVIPPPGSQAPTASSAEQISDGFVVTGDVDATYAKLGQVLASGSLGQVAAHDDAAHSYTVNVVGGELPAAKPGFFGRLFGHHPKPKASRDAGTHAVQISVSASGDKASEVRAQGDAGAVAKAVDQLKQRMGG